MRVVVGGPPQSGKSTFTASLVQAIRERQRNRPYQLSFSWLPLDVTDNSIAVLLDPDGESEQKRDVDWSPERADERRAMFEARDEQLVLADAPGLITEELQIVLKPADALVVLANYEEREQIADWKIVANENEMDVFAELTSILDEDLEPGWDDRASRTGTIRGIGRGDFVDEQRAAYDDTSRRMIRQTATDLLKASSRA